MAHHPLTQYVESIRRLKRYYFRQEDLINHYELVLYTDLSQEEIDSFEQYLRYLGIDGLYFRLEFQCTIMGNWLREAKWASFSCSNLLETLLSSRKQKQRISSENGRTFWKILIVTKQLRTFICNDGSKAEQEKDRKKSGRLFAT